MSMENCSLCRKEAKLICNCTDFYFCEQCIGQHLLQGPMLKHRPMRIVDYFESIRPKAVELTTKPDIKSAISSKLSNEILELEEFRKISLQKISEMVQLIEKELLETVEKVMNMVSDQCEQAQMELKNAVAFLRLPDLPANTILDMFEDCTSALEVRDLCIVHKDLNLVYLNMKEKIYEVVNFSLQITKNPKKIIVKTEEPNHFRSRSNTLRHSTVASEKDDFSEELNYSSNSLLSKSSVEVKTVKKKPVPNRSITPKRPLILENIEMQAKDNPRSTPPTPISISHIQKNQSLLFPYITYFFPNSNKFLIYSVIEATFKTIELPNKIFFEHSNWGICEGGRIIQTGGYDTRPRSDVFVFKLSTETVEKCANMQEKRYKHAQVSLGNFVYAIGGLNKSPLRSVERLDLLDFKWKKVGNLAFPRVSPGACAHQSKIYIAGGEGLKSIEQFNPVTKKFTLLPVNFPETGRLCMFSYDEKILVLKGQDKIEFDTQNFQMALIGNLEEKEWELQGENYAMNNEIYFMSNQTLFRYDLLQSQVSLVKSLI